MPAPTSVKGTAVSVAPLRAPHVRIHAAELQVPRAEALTLYLMKKGGPKD